MSDEVDDVRISKTMAFLLRHRPDVGNLTLDDYGWARIDELSDAVGRLLKVEIEAERMRSLVLHADQARFELRDQRIRAIVGRRGPRGQVPDILYHATTADLMEQYRQEGRISGGRRRAVYLADDETAAWRVAHRLSGSPRVLYVDSGRARRAGVQLARNRRNGLYHAPELPSTAALNLLPNFAEQLSAGGIPLQVGPDGKLRMLLIRVTRRSGRTWEVAKGKLEEGEPPEHTAIREVQEEMGLDVDLRVTGLVGLVRYGFLAPGGLPRLKTIYLYVMEPLQPIDQEFRPAEREGIGEVRWFTPEAACRAVTHSSLIPAMRRALRMVQAPPYCA